MKLSQFNNTIVHNNSFVMYNAYTNKFMAIEPFQNDLIESAKLYGNIDELLVHDPMLYIDMIENGLIVNDNRDELEAVKQLRNRVDLENDTVYQLIINPTMNCNFNCWYCYEDHLKDSKMEAPTVTQVKRHIEHVVNTMPNIKLLDVGWFGGEPLLYFKTVVDPIMNFVIAYFKEKNIAFETGFTTNGFLINDEMIEKFKTYNLNGLQITLDGNREAHNSVRFVSKTRGSYDDIVNNIRKLCRNRLNVVLRINYTRSTLEKLEEVLHELSPIEMEYRRYLRLSLHKVWQAENTDLGDRVLDLVNFFKQNSFYAQKGALPNNVRKSCYADKKNHATINYNGEVFKCTARKFSSEAKEGALNEDGSISWNEKYYHRLDSKFKNKPCLSCPILPICNGGCSQHAIENTEDYCVYNFDDQLKKAIVLDKYLETLEMSAPMIVPETAPARS